MMHIALSCDGHRFGQPCRGALHTQELEVAYAVEEAERKGWRKLEIDHNVVWLCQSSGHDEEKP